MEPQLAKGTMGTGGTDARTVTGAGTTPEEQALTELGHTAFSRGVAWTLTATFLVTVLVVPIVQVWSELKDPRWRASARSDGASPSVVHPDLPAGPGVFDGVRRLIALVPGVRQMRGFATAFGQQPSVVGGFVRPRVQALITGWFGVGNDTDYVGRDRWLFYRIGVDYVIGPGFLSTPFLARRSGTADVQQPDPRPAILRLRDQLARRGIALVLFPTPDKIMMYPERFHASSTRWTSMPQNPSYRDFRNELEQRGVHVFDPADKLYSKRAEQQLFLRADTHWMPGTVESVARDLAQDVRGLTQWPRGPANYRVRDVDVNLPQFDLINLLESPAGQAFLEPTTVRVRQVVSSTGDLWTPTPSAGLLMLGDSFCMIYENDQAGRPLAAGLAQQLSYELGRPIDRICVPGGGSHQSRLLLTNDLVTGARHLMDVRVVIWQFAIRDLAAGDWPVIDLPGS
jgi:hypothetical protein